MTEPNTAASAAIRALNDKLRTTLTGGKVMITAGIQAMSLEAQARVLAAVRAFDAFDRDNDPHGEHDFGAITLQGHRLFFKIDYYDLNLEGHSPDAADSAQTHRVLTIMLASEY